MSQRVISYLCLGLFLFSFPSCGTTISGRVNSLANGTHKEKATFYVIQNNPHSLTDRHIKEVIIQEMEKLGFKSINSRGTAEYLVVYQFSIGEGETKIYPSVVFEGSNRSVTVYPRNFTVIIVDNVPEADPNNPGILWQAELASKGTKSDMSVLADYFIPQMFQRYGKSVTNEMFEVETQ